ncbi:hypothetical protein FQR65_LT11830 [Abscondita terminalis]|nr:hypothetical protein FQR65_LT11830 [Abscondita terminalis]
MMRTTCRTRLTKLINNSNDLIKSEIFEAVEAVTLVARIKAAQESLRVCNEKIASQIGIDDLEAECTKIMEYEECVILKALTFSMCIEFNKLQTVGNAGKQNNNQDSEGMNGSEATFHGMASYEIQIASLLQFIKLEVDSVEQSQVLSNEKTVDSNKNFQKYSRYRKCEASKNKLLPQTNKEPESTLFNKPKTKSYMKENKDDE